MKKLLTPQDAAEILGVDVNTVIDIINGHEIAYVQIGENIRISEDELDAYIDRQTHTWKQADGQTCFDGFGKQPKKKAVRHKYGEYCNVLLSDEDFEKWKSECPLWKEYIEKVSSYVDSSGKSYKNYLSTLRNWYRRDCEKGRAVKKPESEASYDLDEYERWTMMRSRDRIIRKRER
jgi:excisionase family DNA binding protein